jgi:hypothetical protein
MTDLPDTQKYKVGKVIQRHSMDGMADELENRWTGENGEARSLRDLATYFNRELLKSVLAKNDKRYRRRDVAHIFESLTEDDVSPGERTRVRKQLERDGIDVEALEQEFVTHQAIHTFLTQGRGVTKDTEPGGDRLGRAKQTINSLRNRVIAVTETTITQLSKAEILTIGSFDIFVDLTVHCADCGTSISVSELFESKGCECTEME